MNERTATVARIGTAVTIAYASTYYLPAIVAPAMAADTGVATTTVFLAFSAALTVAALAGPMAGRLVDRRGGRRVLAGNSLVFAAGLGGLALAQGPVGLFAAWLVIGLAMAAGLYESAFSTLVRLYGSQARPAITGVTLIAGFASTVGWPLTAWLQAAGGWRSACAAWAALHLCIALPLYLSLPRDPAPAAAAIPAAAADTPATRPRAPASAAWLLAFVFGASWFVSTAMAAHLPRVLQSGGVTLAAAVGFAALVGPAQVAGRLLEYGLLRRWSPLASARLASLGHLVGACAFLAVGAPAGAAFALLHGAGNGIMTIANGTLPLLLFGPHGYGERQGLLMMPARFAQALAPFAFGLALDAWGMPALVLSMALGAASFAALAALRAPRA
ncbi:MFS transporter [Ramlibacter tataouinensis]|uniref:Candidate transporter n=1 Tax=Ramlibacter tataouinensis (strain ATCC BAA-407 / DSM 14655 / LMG 21543 / TTB310) TaxID=365046 RepID=F5Y157_RAMTT|nr:MFS transporter [Ramlibacter tataouinensis]AEG93458.1 Candidate transporter [Ramlibacter tataouinensis TTB310]